MSAHDDRHRAHVELVGIPRADDGPAVVLLPEKAVGRLQQVGQVVDRGPNAPQHPHDELEPEGLLHHPFPDQEIQVVEVAHVVDLELRPGPCLLHLLDEVLDAAEGVGEDGVLAALQPGLLPVEPVVLVLEAAGDGVEGEVEGAHVAAGQLRLPGGDHPHPLCGGHGEAAAGAGADDRVGPGLDGLEDLPVDLHVRGGGAGLGVPGVDVDHRGPGLCAEGGVLGQALRGPGQVGRLGGHGDGPGQRGGDDDFSHGIPPRGPRRWPRPGSSLRCHR